MVKIYPNTDIIWVYHYFSVQSEELTVWPLEFHIPENWVGNYICQEIL